VTLSPTRARTATRTAPTAARSRAPHRGRNVPAGLPATLHTAIVDRGADRFSTPREGVLAALVESPRGKGTLVDHAFPDVGGDMSNPPTGGF
jgi:hypothetical protein